MKKKMILAALFACGAFGFLRGKEVGVVETMMTLLAEKEILYGNSEIIITHDKRVNAVAITSDSSHVASGSSDNKVKLWNKSTGQVKKIIKHSKPVNSIAMTPDGSYVASASDDKTVKLWGGKDKKKAKTIIKHSKPVKLIAMTPDGNHVVSGSDYNTIKLWNKNNPVKKGKVIIQHDKKITGVAISFDGRFVASSSHDGTVKLWDRKKSTDLEQGLVIIKSPEAVTTVAIADNSKGDIFVVAGGKDGMVKLWNSITKQVKNIIEHDEGDVWSVVITSDGSSVMSAGGLFDEKVKRWDKATGQVEDIIEFKLSGVTLVAIAHDGEYVVAFSSRMVKRWDKATRQVKKIILRDRKKGYAAKRNVHLGAITPDGSYVVSTSGPNNETVKLWEAPPPPYEK